MFLFSNSSALLTLLVVATCGVFPAHAQSINDITSLASGFQGLKDEFAKLSSPLKIDPIPVLGKSLPDLIAPDSGQFEEVVNWVGFVDDFKDKFNTSTATVDAIRDELLGFIQDLDGTVNVGAGQEGGSHCIGSNPLPVDVVLIDNEVATISFCMLFQYSNRVAELSGAGLLDKVADNRFVDLDISQSVTLEASIAFAGAIQVNLTDSSFELAFDPIRVSLGASATPQLSINFGFIEMKSDNAVINAGVQFVLDYCTTSACPGPEDQVPGSDWYLTKSGEYFAFGDLTLQGSFPGIDVAADAQFSLVVADNVFDDSSSPVFDVTGFDLDDFTRGLDITALTAVFSDLLSNFQGFQDIRSDFDLVYQPIPVIGKSISELVLGDSSLTLDKIVDFVSFVQDTTASRGSNHLPLAGLRSELLTYLGIQDDDTSIDIEGSSSDECGPFAVAVSLDDNNVLKLAICAGLTYSRQTDLDGSGLFRSVPDAIEVDLEASLDLDVSLKLGASFLVDLNDPANFTFQIDPLVASLTLDASPSATLALGTLELISEAQASASATFAIEYCSEIDICPLGTPNASQLGNGTIFFHRSATYLVEGDLALGMDFANVEVGDTASFRLQDENAFDDLVPSLDVTSFDFSDFVKFSPENCIAFLRILDR